ncbi:MAG: winged helix-turn-helix transcriptional regulator [Candidatus Micrarchaeota archaeon]|nr:winged helix-turn-helix transcriptional regulator [Candidatus Micrarchaeota archaeon]
MLDKKDEIILDMLSNDARIAVTEIAKKLGISNTATKKRISRLEKNGIIRGYRLDVDFQMMGKDNYMILVNVPSGKSSLIQKALSETDIALFKANNFERTMFYAFVSEKVKDRIMESMRKNGLDCLSVKVSRVI